MASRGQVLTYAAGGTDRHGREVATYTAGLVIRCGLGRPSTREADDTIPLADWELRLPHGTAITSRDRFLITEYRGQAVQIETAVVGQVYQGPAAVVVQIARVTNG